jgi:putative ABC transport system permease protein
MESGSRLHRLVNVDGDTYTLPSSGGVLTANLARVLGVHAGDTIQVELLERGGIERSLVVAGVFDAMTGQEVFMERSALNRLLREADAISGAYLDVALGGESEVFAALKDLPGVAATTSRAATIQNINEQMRQSMVFVLTLIISSACVIAVGVVYNSARIALSERGRELASLRVLGFTTNEVSGMLLGEQGAITAVAIPLGIAFGAVFSLLLTKGFETERFHFPFVVAWHSQLVAAGLVIVAGVLAGLMVRGRLRRLDMVAALRTRE